MTTLAEKFRLSAQRTVLKFSTGTHVLKKILSESYDPPTGVVTRVFDDTNAPAAQYDIDADKYEKSYVDSHAMFVFAGLDLGVEFPEPGDIIETPDGVQYLITDIPELDQYGAHYECHVGKTPWL